MPWSFLLLYYVNINTTQFTWFISVLGSCELMYVKTLYQSFFKLLLI